MSRRMRRGFTLLELLLAITITSVIAAMALVAADVGLASGERVMRHRETGESRALVRALLSDALRHTVDGNGPADTVFAVWFGRTRDGLPNDAFRFRTRGIPPLLGGEHEWWVTVRQDDDGLLLLAEPDAARLPTLQMRLADVRGVAVRVVPSADSVWVDRWSAPGTVPRAIDVRFVDGAGSLLGGPLVVRVGRHALRPALDPSSGVMVP